MYLSWETYKCKQIQVSSLSAHLEQWSWRKAPRELEGWGFKKRRVSPSIGQPKVPLGTGPSLKNNGKKWLKMRPNKNPNMPTTRESQKPPAMEERSSGIGTFTRTKCKTSLATSVYIERICLCVCFFFGGGGAWCWEYWDISWYYYMFINREESKQTLSQIITVGEINFIRGHRKWNPPIYLV